MIGATHLFDRLVLAMGFRRPDYGPVPAGSAGGRSSSIRRRRGCRRTHELTDELHRIETDPESRALFVDELDAAIAERLAEVAELEALADSLTVAVAVAVETLRSVIHPSGKRAV